MTDDLELLRSYAVSGSDEAFRTVLERHVGLVYSAALRQVRNPHLAEEITQAVFVVLARKAGSLRSGTVLVGWLFRTTRFVAARAVRDELRRQRREQEAAQMEPGLSLPAEASWDEIAPTLDEALACLGETDRHAVLLRFFEKKELKEVGRALGSSEDAVQKRISRALEKLRSFFVRRGMILSGATLAAVLVENSVQAAPAGLSNAAFAVAAGKAGTVTTFALAKAAIEAMFYAKLKTAALGVGVLLVLVGTGLCIPSVLHDKSAPRFVSLPLEQVDGMPLASFGPENLWSCLPAGLRTYGGVPFQISMRVQLHGNQDAKELRRYPARVMGIPVHQRLARLHVVQGANMTDREGQPVAALHIHYAGGTTHTVFLNYGVHTREWWQYPTEQLSSVSDTNTIVVWRGHSTDGDRLGATHRMFKTTFDLPASEEPVESIDAVSLFGRSSLVILAMTGELPGPGSVGTPAPSADDTQFRDAVVLKATDGVGKPLFGARVSGLAVDERGVETTLGKLDDTFSQPGFVPVDFPAGTRELRLRVTASGYVPAEVEIKTVAGESFGHEATVQLAEASREIKRGGALKNDPQEREAAKAAAAEAYSLKRSGYYREAIPAFEAAIREYPNYSDSYHGLAQAQRESGNPSAALANHTRAIQLDPGRYDLYWERGLTYLRMKYYDDAITDFEACLERNQRFANAHLGLAEAYRDKRDFKTALIHHDEAIALKPDSASFYRERGNTYRRMGNQQLADADFAQVRELQQNAK